MKFTKLLFVFAVTTTFIFVCIWGGTYAWYTTTEGTDIEVTTGNLETGLAIIFTQSEYINTKTGIPISDEDVDKYADKTVFTLAPDSTILNGYEINVNISLVNVSISEELKNDAFKYKLDCDDGTNKIALNSGTGTNITSNTIDLGNLSTASNTFDITKTYTCTLRTWLQATITSQNELMNKRFDGTIKVNTAFRK